MGSGCLGSGLVGVLAVVGWVCWQWLGGCVDKWMDV